MNTRAKGDGFFFKVETRHYQPAGSLFGQIYDDSCVAACCRMLLQDQGLNLSESVIRAALRSEIGGVGISKVPQALKELGLMKEYAYRGKLSLEDLKLAVAEAPALVYVKENPLVPFGHSLIIDAFEDDWALIRDPWPPNFGASYKVELMDFAPAWLLYFSGIEFTGRAVVIKIGLC